MRKPFDRLDVANYRDNSPAYIVGKANAAIAADKAHAEQVVSEMGAKVAELMQQLAGARGVIEELTSTGGCCCAECIRGRAALKQARAYLEKYK